MTTKPSLPKPTAQELRDLAAAHQSEAEHALLRSISEEMPEARDMYLVWRRGSLLTQMALEQWANAIESKKGVRRG